MKRRLVGTGDKMGCEVFSALCQRHLLTFKGDIPP